MNTANSPFHIGNFRIDPASNAIIGPDGQTLVEPKVMAVLVQLFEHKGEVVTRDELIDAVWSREYSGDESLTRAVSLLRKALGDQRGGTRWIETIPKRGYRLLAPEAPTAAPQEVTGGAPDKRAGRLAAILVMAVAIVAAIAAIAIVRDKDTVPATGPAAEPVLAVLPFDYQGSETVDAHLADGLADEVLSSLARSPKLSVIAGTSSFRFREERKNLDLLRRELAVTHLVDGTVRRSASGLRVGVHLVDVSSGLVLWSDVFERADDAFYSIPPDVSSAVLAALGAGSKTTADLREPDPQAYQAYLQARALIRSGTEPNLAQALTLLERAVERDPDFADAWGQLAMARLNVLVTFDNPETADPPERRRAIRSAAKRALERDPDSVNGRLALATIDFRDRVATLAETEDRYRALVALAPRNPDVNVRLGMLLMVTGHLEEAFERFQAAYDLDRYSGLISAMYANSFFMIGRWDDGHAILREQQRASALPVVMIQQFVVFLLQRDFDAARQWADRLRSAPQGSRWERQPDTPARAQAVTDRLIVEIERDGRISDDAVAELMALTEAGFLIPPMTIQLLGVGGRDDEVYSIIEEQFAQGDLIMPVATFDPAIAGLRAQPRVMRLYAASGQLAYWLATDSWPDFCRDPKLTYDCRAVGEELAAQGIVSGG